MILMYVAILRYLPLKLGMVQLIQKYVLVESLIPNMVRQIILFTSLMPFFVFLGGSIVQHRIFQIYTLIFSHIFPLCFVRVL